MKKTAQVVLINKEGLVLGVSRKTDHNDFGLPGGKMDPEDSDVPMVTAYRETLEETGLKISNLRLVFAIHKDGFMGFTYLADYEGEIHHNEPHIVKWVPFNTLIQGSFGKYNKMVGESLDDMGVKYQLFDKPDEEYIFGIINDEETHHDYPLICVSSRKYWNEHNCVPYPWTDKDSNDIYNLCGNSGMYIAGVDETSFEVILNNKVLLRREEIIKVLTSAGFIHDAELQEDLDS